MLPTHSPSTFLTCLLLATLVRSAPDQQDKCGKRAIDRKSVVRMFNPVRTASSDDTPLQVGNGDFAFGADVTGLQTFRPFATMSTWGWHSFDLPNALGQTSVEDFHGVQWLTHGRNITYNQPDPEKPAISNWIRENPHRINLGLIGLHFPNARKPITESDLTNKTQVLDMWTGTLTSNFIFENQPVKVETIAHPEFDTMGIRIESPLLASEEIGLFFDFPYPTNEKFNAPFVGVLNRTHDHETELRDSTEIVHTLGNTTYGVYVWSNSGTGLAGPVEDSHRYTLVSAGRDDVLELTVTFALQSLDERLSFKEVRNASRDWWEGYWLEGSFVDLTGSEAEDALEIQRRVVQSLYLVAVNSASRLPPQGLVNNGWYGKFHMEMYLWHSLQFARWNHWSLLERSLSHLYQDLLPLAYERAKNQGYDGARWGKMTGPDLVDAPGDINAFLIWQQPHPMYFAEIEYRKAAMEDGEGHQDEVAIQEVLGKWDEVLTASAEFLASFAWLNESSGYYDLGPPMYPVSENTQPNVTRNPTFELAYWRLGLDVAILWKERQGLEIPEAWTTVRDNLAPLPVVDGTYPVYEGIPGMWTNNATTMDHPAMAGIYGLLPEPLSGPKYSNRILHKTASMIRSTWDLDQSFGWDFPMLAMNSLRLGDIVGAVEYLLHPTFQFDDAGYPVGGSRVPTPYFPGSGSLLLAVAMMAGGWDGAEGMHFPEEWNAVVEGFVPGL